MRPENRALLNLFIVFIAFALLSLKTFLSLVVIYVSYNVYQIASNMQDNPFKEDKRRPREAYVTDQKKRDSVLKQSFAISKVPENLDAIVIGSGIGGLTTATLLSKIGKKVLVLEQHDQAGGCCHTFIDKGYEFDVGIHYIGEIGPKELNRTLVDHLTDGQLQWEPLVSDFDIVTTDYQNQFPIKIGKEAWKQSLLKQFPDEGNAIEKYFEIVEETKKFDDINGILKILPLWVSWIIAKSGILKLYCNLWSGLFQKTTLEAMKSLTNNKDLQTIFTYSWGDYGAPPHTGNLIMMGCLANHFMHSGGYYPIGGASEIAYNMIPIIEKSQGKVLVKANVTEILVSSGQAYGVKVKKGKDQEHTLFAPIIISNAGLHNTFHKLLPKEIASQSIHFETLKNFKPGVAAMSVFIGLNASNEELNLKAQNTWAFTSNDLDTFEDYYNLDSETVQDTPVPLMFVSFPSAKDPKWNLHAGRQSKSTCVIVTISNWAWFQDWQNKPLKKRGDEYDAVKKSIGQRLVDQACQLYPQIKDKIDYIEVGSPVTNKHYLAAPFGEIYGLDHGFDRFDPWNLARLRPQTDIPGLYMTGQDAMLCGFTGALFGGLLCTGAILGRHVMGDLENLHAKVLKTK